MVAELSSNDCLLLCIDYQENLLPKIHMADEIIKNAIIMIKSAKVLDIPIIVTEQYPKGLGKTIDSVMGALGESYEQVKKVHFNSFGSSDFVNKLGSFQRRHLLVMGVESHICVYQTVLEALRRNYRIYLLEDAISSRNPENRRIAIDRMIKEGAIPSSVEMVLYELLKCSGTREFKKILQFVK